MKRAVETLGIVLEKMGIEEIPTASSWRLNERHYGALQGLNKAEATKEFGEEQVRQWRRSFDIPPPALEPTDPWHPVHNPRYANIQTLPSSESLKDTIVRTMPYWEQEIVPAVKSGMGILICAHGNSLRAIIKHLDGISNEEIAGLNVPTGVPLVYEFDAKMNPLVNYYLGDAQGIFAAINSVANQATKPSP